MVVQAESESIPVDTAIPVVVAVLELMLHMSIPTLLCQPLAFERQQSVAFLLLQISQFW